MVIENNLLTERRKIFVQQFTDSLQFSLENLLFKKYVNIDNSINSINNFNNLERMQLSFLVRLMESKREKKEINYDQFFEYIEKIYSIYPIINNCYSLDGKIDFFRRSKGWKEYDSFEKLLNSYFSLKKDTDDKVEFSSEFNDINLIYELLYLDYKFISKEISSLVHHNSRIKLMPVITYSNISTEDYFVYSKLGQGKSACVYLAYSPKFDDDVAIKVFKDNNNTEEIKFLAKIKDPALLKNLVRIYSTTTVGRNKKSALIMEYVDGSTLEELLTERGYLEENEVFKISSQIYNGIISLQNICRYHDDLNLSNIKLDSKGIVKILDFGIATNYNPLSIFKNYVNYKKLRNDYPKRNNRKFGNPYSPDDFFSLGLITYQLATGEHLLLKKEANENNSTFSNRINDSKKNIFTYNGKLKKKYRKKIPDYLKELVTICLEPNENKKELLEQYFERKNYNPQKRIEVEKIVGKISDQQYQALTKIYSK